MKSILLYLPRRVLLEKLYRHGNWGPARLSDLLKVTESARVTDSMQTSTRLRPEFVYFSLYVLSSRDHMLSVDSSHRRSALCFILGVIFFSSAKTGFTYNSLHFTCLTHKLKNLSPGFLLILSHLFLIHHITLFINLNWYVIFTS